MTWLRGWDNLHWLDSLDANLTENALSILEQEMQLPEYLK
jgi:hypothetical protein